MQLQKDVFWTLWFSVKSVKWTAHWESYQSSSTACYLFFRNLVLHVSFWSTFSHSRGCLLCQNKCWAFRGVYLEGIVNKCCNKSRHLLYYLKRILIYFILIMVIPFRKNCWYSFTFCFLECQYKYRRRLFIPSYKFLLSWKVCCSKICNFCWYNVIVNVIMPLY